MTEQKPSIGRIVHFRDQPDDQCRAAIVVGLSPDTEGLVDLYAFPTWGKGGGIYPGVPDTNWHWPERV